MSNKTRLDVLLTERGLAESRQKAQAVIMAGHVFVAGQRVDKPGTAVLSDAPIEVRGHALPYVSRGGLKLEKAMKTFPITLTDKICADIGASTGGFTDCMLQNGARKVYSVDVQMPAALVYQSSGRLSGSPPFAEIHLYSIAFLYPTGSFLFCLPRVTFCR